MGCKSFSLDTKFFLNFFKKSIIILQTSTSAFFFSKSLLPLPAMIQLVYAMNIYEEDEDERYLGEKEENWGLL